MTLYVNRNLALEAVIDNVAPVHGSDARAKLAVQFIAAGSRVLNLGGGDALRHLLPAGCRYESGDVSGEFPTRAAANSDVIVLLGALEQIADVETFFTHLRFCKRDVILSYHATDLPADGDRAARGFINALSCYDLAVLFDRYAFRIQCTAPVGAGQVLMRITPAERLRPVTNCSVAVISDGSSGIFGNRLGRQTINALLPGEADVHHLTFDTLAQARGTYDLVVLGTGNGMFQPLLDGGVLDVLSRAKASIGIFGTQYRELIPRPALDRVLDRLDTWFARHEDDVLMFGRGRKNVVHLGDWLIDQFPMTEATDDEPLEIGGEIGNDEALDRVIQTVQRHKQVYSAALQPLLCALTSAELVAYREQTAQMPGTVSGEFRSTLIDIFGRSYPELKFFMVDRDAVRRYKARVHRNVAKVGARIDSILRNVAAAAT